MKKNFLIKISSIITILMIAVPTLSYADTIDKNKNPLEYKAIRDIEMQEQKEAYLEIALNLIQEYLGITKSELLSQSNELSSLYEYIDNAYKLKISESEFSDSIIKELTEKEKEQTTDEKPTKSLFKYFLIIFFIAVAITSSWNYILFKVKQIKLNNIRK